MAAASLGVAALCTTALGQADLNGDGHIEVAFGEPGTNELVMLNGATGAELWRKSGPDVFGWAASAHPDVNADGLADVIVTAPGFGAGAPGQVQALRGTDGQVLWSRQYGAVSAKFGLGLGVIPDQDSDGVTDILVAMLSADPSGETAVLLSGKTGAVLATAAGPVANLLETTRSGAFKFKTKDLDGSGVVEVADAALVAQAAGSNDTDADVDFSGDVDAEDTSKVLDEALAPPTAPLTPGQYILLTLEDPLRYNDGYRLVSLVTQPAIPAPPEHPCKDLYDAMQDAARAWAEHMLTFDWQNPIGWGVWRQRADTLRDAYRTALKALNDCLAGQGLPPITTPDTPIPPFTPPTTPPPPPPPPPQSGCPLDNSYPPPTPSPGSPQDPCFNQMQTNILVCMTCRDFAISTEPYADCLERAKALYRACKAQVVNP